MVSSDLKKAIFQSVPKSLNGQDIFVEYSDRCNVSQRLKTYAVVVTLRYFGGRPDKARTPTNHILSVDRAGDEIVYMKGEVRQETLSINVYAVDTDSQKAGDIIDAYLDLLQVWVLRDLPGIVEVVSNTGASDLSYLETSAERRNLDIILRDTVHYLETKDAAGEVGFTVRTDFSL